MKNLFFLALFMLISTGINAQDDDADVPKALDSLLNNIDQSLVTSGIIYERTLQLADLYNFNTKGYANTANYHYFRQCLLEMYRASNGKKFISLDTLENRINDSDNENMVSIGILNTQFNILNYNEEEPLNGGLVLDSITKKFIQIQGVPPFYMMHNTVIAPLKDAINASSITFKFSEEFFFTNGQKIINNLVVDFGDNRKYEIISNGYFNEQNITIAYDKNGDKTLVFTIEYNDGTSLITKAQIYFRNVNSNSSNYVSCANNTDQLRQDFTNVQADIDFTGYREGDPKIKSKIDYRVYYSNGNTQKLIKKPVIIIDGFDPGDRRKIEDCDCEQDAECAKKYKTNGNFDPEKHRSINDIMVYYENTTKRELLPILRGLGYDVIIVNFPNYTTTNLNTGQNVSIDGGAYYIESNAMSIIKLIKNIRNQLVTNGSTNQIAVIAPSMAGQISRYALSYMEKKFQETSNNDWRHNVYLWVSVDSPHLGANIPLGDQALLSLAKNSSTAANDFYRKQLSSPAAQQQLIEFHREKIIPNLAYPQFSSNPLTTTHSIAEPSMLDAQTISQGLTMNRGNSLFQEHYNRQNNNGIVGSSGWPMNLRKVALVNGSLTGSKENQAVNGNPLPNFANDGEKVLNIRGFQRIHISLPVGSIVWYVHIASLESHFMASTGKTDRICRFKKLFNDKTTIATNINKRGVMDNVPGGFLDAQQQIAGPTLDTNVVPGTNIINSFSDISLENFIFSISQSLGGSRWFLHDFNPLNSFIPTFSAIAHLEPNQNWNNALNYNLACPTNKKTPFDSYFGGDKNTQHTSFSKESVDWLLKELNGQPQLPNYPLGDNLLIGPDSICLNNNITYTFNNPCKFPSAVTNWSVSDNLQIIAQSDYSITIKAIENGNAFIKAIFGNGIATNKYLYAGAPKLENFTFGTGPSSQNLCIASSENYSYSIPELNTTNSVIANFEGQTVLESTMNTNFEWQTYNNIISLNGIKNKRNICTLDAGYTSVSVRAKNSCGWSNWYELPFEITALPPTFNKMYTVFPNPSSNVVNIDLADVTKLPQVTDIITGELFDLLGFSKGTISITNNKATFSVSGLVPGIYIVKIFINGVPESHQIAVQ
jgi:hypothetical protein